MASGFVPLGPKALAVGEDGLTGGSGVGPRSSKSVLASGKENLVPGAFDLDLYPSKVAALGQESWAKGRSTKGKAAAAAEEEEDAGCISGEAPAGTGLWMLPDEEVQLVLSWKRERLTPGLVSPEGIEAFESLSACIDKYQDWMGRNYEANGGFVLVDDDFVARREEHYRLVEEELAAEVELGDPLEGLDFAYWNISDRLSDFYESDGDEEDVQDAKAN